MRYTTRFGASALHALRARVIAGDHRELVPGVGPATNLCVQVGARAATLRMAPAAVSEDEDLETILGWLGLGPGEPVTRISLGETQLLPPQLQAFGRSHAKQGR